MSEPIDPKQTPPWFSISNQVIGFCVGMVVCALIILYAPEHYSKISEVLRGFYYMVFGAALFIFIVIVGFRPYVQRYVLNRAPNKVRGTIEDMQNVSDHIMVQLLDLLPKPPSEDIKARARAFLPGLTNLLIWSRLRNWWWQWILGIFVAIGGLMGTILLMNQNDLLNSQNDLLNNQNDLLNNQNTLIQRQMSLEEASRRSALVVLMSNIMDKVDREIDRQQDLLPKEKRDSARFQLSQSLIGQIASLSHSFKPYRYMSGDTLIPEPLSPERGQLLITLTSLPLDSATLFKIYISATFRNADLQGAVLIIAYLRGADLRDADLRDADLILANLRGANLRDADLSEADLSGAKLIEADLFGANLMKANLFGANLMNGNLMEADLREAGLSGTDLRDADLRDADLIGADLRGADLRDADLIGADLRGVDLFKAKLMEADLRDADLSGAKLIKSDLSGAKLSFEVLKQCSSLYGAKDIPESILAQLKQKKPELFERPKY